MYEFIIFHHKRLPSSIKKQKMSILEKIQANEITNLRISDADDDLLDNSHKLIEALKNNTSIVSVRFDADFLGCLRNDARSKLAKAIGKIPSLQEVHLEDALLMVMDIADMLEQAKSLRVLKLNNLVLQGVSEHFDACETALYQHGCLKEFAMDDCIPAMKEISLEKLHQAGRKQVSATPIGSPVHMAKSARTA
jgi:hypothetical protein